MASPRERDSLGRVTSPADADYPKTTWGMLGRLDPARPGFRTGIECLCRRYWSPIHHYVRAALSTSEPDADDLTQEFFAWLLDGKVLARYERERGSFRNYLKGLLRNFARNHQRSARRQRRLVSGEPLDEARAGADPRVGLEAAEAVFDGEFVRAVTARAVARVRERLLAQPRRASWWQLFEEFELAAPGLRPTYRDLAERHRVSDGEIKNRLHRVRGFVRDEIRIELADTVSDPDDLEDEWRHVVG